MRWKAYHGEREQKADEEVDEYLFPVGESASEPDVVEMSDADGVC